MRNQKLINRLAEELYWAWKKKKIIRPFSQEFPEFSLEEAYEIQRQLVGMLEKDGCHCSGRKMGYTNPAMQQQLNLKGPSYGRLFSEYRWISGTTLPVSRFIQPGIEAEILFVLKKDLCGLNCSREEVISSIDYFRISLEIVDMRQSRQGKKQKDSVADNASFGGYIVGEEKFPYKDLDLSSVEVYMKKNGETVARGQGNNVMKNPIQSLLWAANYLAQTEDYLREGEEFLSGSFIPLIPASDGDSFEAIFSTLGSVCVTFGEGAL